jgi:pimeloyl-ACP methyl ester carboxylesterase
MLTKSYNMLYSKIEGSGPLLILHGFLGMSDNWKTIGTKLKLVLKFTTRSRNHGRSIQSLEFSYELMTQDVLNIY